MKISRMFTWQNTQVICRDNSTRSSLIRKKEHMLSVQLVAEKKKKVFL